MSNVTQFPDKHIPENDMLSDLNNLVDKYSGQMTNVSMLGCLQVITNFVFLDIASNKEDPED
jgi:hypothetical protein